MRSGNSPGLAFDTWESSRSWTGLIGLASFCLAALVAIAPQLIRGNSCGHDFDFHLVSWLDASIAGSMAFSIRIGRRAPTTARASRDLSSIRR